MQASRYDARARRTLRHDDAAVSEVIGYILSLGILSILLISTLVGFGVAQNNTAERAVLVQGDAMLQEISGTAIQAALFAEDNPDTDLEFTGRINLPFDLEGHPYTVDLDPDEVTITFSRFPGSVSTPLFQAGAHQGITICDQDPIPGGPIRLLLRPDTHPDVPAGCDDAAGDSLALFLEIDS